MVTTTRREVRTWMVGHAIAKHSRRERPKMRPLGLWRVVLDRDQKRHIGGSITRHPSRRGVDITLEKDVRNDALKKHHGRDDDDQRAPEEATRQDTLDQPKRAEPPA